MLGAAGFSLLELLVTIAVAAILVMVAVPSYRGLVQDSGAAAEVNELITALNYARSTAVARGSSVAVCASADQTHCRTGDEWRDGWIVYAENAGLDGTRPNDVLRVHHALAPGVDLVTDSSHPIRFNSSGFNLDPRKWVASAEAGTPPRTICVAATGRIRVAAGTACS